MGRTDVNCLLGHWPFRRIYKGTFDDLKDIHKGNGIEYGYVSSINGIFYNDPFEGDEELHEIIKGSGYRHILTVNPTLPHYIEDIRRGIEFFDIKGVRIYPGYHGYQINSAPVDELCGILLELGLPLFITMRLEDERLDYILKPKAPAIEEMADFLRKHTDNAILLLTIRYHEVLALKDHINTRTNIFFDTSGLKDLLFVIEKLLSDVNAGRMVYGSLHPLFCLRSTALLVEKAQIDDPLKENIFGANADFLQL